MGGNEDQPWAPGSRRFDRTARRRGGTDCTVLYCAVLYCTVLHCTVLDYTILC